MSRYRFISGIFILLLSLLVAPNLSAQDAPEIVAKPIPYEPMRLLRYIKGEGVAKLSLPTDVAVNEQGIYVVDGGNHRVVVFDLAGNPRFQFGKKGSGTGQFDSPVGVGLDNKGRVYIADRENRRIQIFDPQGKFLSSFSVKSRGKRVRPIDIAISDDSRELFVSGNRNHRLMVFNRKGKLLREWGENGLNPGQFRFPGSVMVMPDRRIAVIDVLNTRLQLFNPDGDFSVEIGGWGVLPGQLVRPKGVAMDTKGRIYISDSYTEVIQVYTDGGVFLHVLQEDQPVKKLVTPTGIAIDYKNRLYVTEILENRVAVFQLPR